MKFLRTPGMADLVKRDWELALTTAVQSITAANAQNYMRKCKMQVQKGVLQARHKKGLPLLALLLLQGLRRRSL